MKAVAIGFVLLLGSLFAYPQAGYVQEGKASFYADRFEGRTTASGERYSHSRSTCAHLTLPFGTLVRVTNLENNLTVVVRVNDRGPFVPNRIIDLSKSAAEKLDFINAGVADVRIEVVDETSDWATSEPQKPSAPKPAEKPKPVQEQPVAVSKPSPQKPAEPAPAVSAPKPSAPVATAPAQAPSAEVELYDLSISKISATGFAIQIGSYKELANLLRIANDLKSTYQKEVRVQVSTVKGERIYRLMVGQFKTRAEADAFRAKVAQNFPDCFIVEFK
jgi:rare lipoprotein A